MNDNQLGELLDEVLFVFESRDDFDGPVLERVVRQEALKLALVLNDPDVDVVTALAYEQLDALRCDPGESYCRAAL